MHAHTSTPPEEKAGGRICSAVVPWQGTCSRVWMCLRAISFNRKKVDKFQFRVCALPCAARCAQCASRKSAVAAISWLVMHRRYFVTAGQNAATRIRERITRVTLRLGLKDERVLAISFWSIPRGPAFLFFLVLQVA